MRPRRIRMRPNWIARCQAVKPLVFGSGGDAMRIVGRMKSEKPARTIRVVGMVYMAAAYLLAGSPALAQDAMGRAQNGVSQSAITQTGSTATSAAKQERTGISHPDPSVITVTPYSDDADSAATLRRPSPRRPPPSPRLPQPQRRHPTAPGQPRVKSQRPSIPTPTL